MSLTRSVWLFLAPVVLFGLQACATKPLPLSQEAFSSAMAVSGVKVDVLVGEAKLDEAVGLLAKMAEDNPAQKEPWVRMARIHFEAENYGNAIVAADEALQRDSTDMTAKGLRAVSGLRVATQSLAELRDDTNLKGSARADALSLAKVLRETLGEDVLVPPVSAEAKRREEELEVRAKPRRKVRRAPVAVAPSPATRSPTPLPVDGDPFSVLK
ncbi:tetratricopeptide repeat protein [Denitromonas ohlonensis]|uniref:Tetratricopeptide repeat protein n=2 Tax=Denitromonas TaxID=139331 RepID=A0A557SD41_9RHOO|nr:tetratricopeptide repeat protein [Denitromonas ohlonensis]TVT44571.1 MAG: tetratricopeptide repeat protein [Denitromonas halophila]TVO63461.1 tetratricopeptide repeat protein [Denitromonas ohlonensis]TVO75338.1 tetratricopeptide repeat protein [Denitromonas ohlonensis]TVT68033.1 MAG: tetratricopeptide repeat protein [Denitromonas halophila]TVT69812.1 MAG: tetratricopeptide repeat protein [Denitromonas halophila]